jgi:hypothetical protein
MIAKAMVMQILTVQMMMSSYELILGGTHVNEEYMSACK